MDLCSVDVSFMPLCTAFVILGPSFDTWTVYPSFIYTTNLGNFIDISFLPSILSLNRFLDSAALDAPSLMSNYIFNTPPPIPWFDLSFLPAHDGGSTDRFAATMCQCRHPLHTLVPLQLSLFRVIAVEGTSPRIRFTSQWSHSCCPPQSSASFRPSITV